MVEGETVRAEAGTPKAESAISVVLGASGGIGNALVRELAGRGLRVRAVSRDGHARVPDGVESCAADLTTADGAARACAEAAVVYHAVQPRYDRWAEEFPALNESIVTAATRAGAKPSAQTISICTGRSRGRSTSSARSSLRAGRVACGRDSRSRCSPRPEPMAFA